MSNMGHLSLKDFKVEIPAICVFVFYLVDRGIITVHASININLFIPLTSPPPPPPKKTLLTKFHNHEKKTQGELNP